MWVANASHSPSDNVAKIDVQTGSVLATVPVGQDPQGIAFDGVHVWVASNAENSLKRIDPATNVVTSFPLGPGALNPQGVAFDGRHLWTGNVVSDNITKVDATTGAVVGTFPAGDAANQVLFDGLAIWVTNQFSGVTKHDPDTGAILATYTSADGISTPYGLAFDGTHMWVANYGNDTVTKIDASTGNVVGSFPAGGPGPYLMAYDGRHILVTHADGSTVSSIDPETGAVANTTTVNISPSGVAFDGVNVWIVGGHPGKAIRR
jgi:YVTN family beta-propeller protein